MSEAVGFPAILLLERFFWLGLGGFLGLAIITSVIRGQKENNDKNNFVSENDLKKLANKAIKKN